MKVAFVHCIVLEDPNDPESRIVDLCYSAQPAETRCAPVSVQDIGPQIHSRLLELSVPYIIGEHRLTTLVEAYQEDGIWLVRTVPDGSKPGNLRSLKQC